MTEPEVQEENPPSVVTVMTTEHFVLQTARSAGITEVNGRAGFYLAAVSSGLIALAFIGQLSGLGTAFYVFGLAAAHAGVRRRHHLRARPAQRGGGRRAGRADQPDPPVLLRCRAAAAPLRRSGA